MVARSPPKQHHHNTKMVTPLDPTLIRETLDKVDKCMARLQELQYTVTGGNKVVSGVTLCPRSTRGFLRSSLRCKQETIRIKNANARRSPGKFPTNTDWRRMSLPAMLLGETVGEILQASQFAKEIEETLGSNRKIQETEDPRTPVSQRRRRNQRRPSPENSELVARRKKEKQEVLQTIRSELDAPEKLQRAKSRINFKVSPDQRRVVEKENISSRYYMANRVSPRHRPWAKKTVLFPNPLFQSSPTSKQQKFCRTKSPVIAAAKQHQTPHKFLIKSPVKIQRSPPLSISPTRAAASLCKKSPKMSTAAKIRRSISPSRLANKLVSPLKSRKSLQSMDGRMKSTTDGMMKMMSGLKQRPISAPRI